MPKPSMSAKAGVGVQYQNIEALTASEFAKYASSLLGELSGIAAGCELTVLAHLLDLAKREAENRSGDGRPNAAAAE